MALSLKIFIVEKNQQKIMRFPQDILVAEAIKDIAEKTNAGGADHGLFQPEEGGKPARWLKENRSLKAHELVSGVRSITPFSLCCGTE